MEANIELLTKVRDHFKKFPQSCNMDFFERTDKDAAKNRGAISMWDGKEFCIGGGAILLSGGKVPDKPFQTIATVRARLGLTEKQTRDMLFFDHADHDGAYNDLRDPLLRTNIGTREYADVVIRVIDRCIAAHSSPQDAIDLEANALCASVELEIKQKPVPSIARVGTFAASLVGACLVVLAVIHFAI